MSSVLMSLGAKALTANYAALQVTGHNIANANVAGYSRQSVELATSQGQFSGAGFFGKGVDVTSVTRSHDEFLTRESARARSLATLDATRLTHLSRLETAFPPGEQGLGYAAASFLNSMADLGNRPGDSSTRQVVLARAGDLATRFAATGRALDAAQQNVDADLRAAVTEVNTLAGAIALANQRIAALKGLGQPANDLLDQRDRLLSRLSEHLSVTRIESDDGTMSVFIGGGQRLVLGTSASPLQLIADPSDPMRRAIGIVEGPVQRPLAEQSLGGGAIAGLLRFQNRDLVDARNALGQMAAALGGAINSQQALGVNLQSPLGTIAGAALFSIGAPQAIAHASNARDGLGNALTRVTLTVVQPGSLQASDYDLQPDPASAGNYVLTRLSDGLVRSVSSGDIVDGMQFDIGPPAAQAGDRFLLQPVARAANGFARLLDDPRDLAAAAPLIALADSGNLGSAAAASLRVTAAPLPVPGANARITFTDDLGNYSWDLLDAGNNVLASGTGAWQAGAVIPAPPADINGFSLSLSGVPRGGDMLTVEPTPANAVSSNNGNALAMLGLRDAALVNGLTPGDAYATLLADIGVRVQGTRMSAEISAAVAAQSEGARSAVSGVSLDEEAARLIQHQQSYQAAAKVLQVAQTLFDTLLQAASAR